MKTPVSKAMRRRNRFIRAYVGLLSVILSLSLSAIVVQSVFATTYVITDGETVVTHTTLATDPVQVLGEAGVSLGEHDTYTTEAVEGGEAITVNRNRQVTIHYRGQTTGTTTVGETVGELLDRLDMAVSGEDVVSHGMTEPTYDGMVIDVDRIQVVRETWSATLAHGTEERYDDTIPQGTREVITQGVDGEVLYTADVTYLNGKEIGRAVIRETVVREQVDEVVGVGTAQPPETLPAGDMPVIGDGRITLPTGEVLTYTHTDTVRATAYTHTDEGCDELTATGTIVRQGTVAVDPRYIPYGTRMFIMASDGSYIYGIATAEDCGGDIKGDRMDLYMPTYEECREFGRRRCTLYFLG